MIILVAVDQEPESAEAASVAQELFGDNHQYIFLSIADFLTSARAMDVGLGRHTAGLAQKVEDSARENAARAAREHAEETGVAGSEIAVDVGAVGPTICEHAATSGADIIVMGSRDHTIWDRIFDPSAGRYVIDHAPCPVLIVR